MTNPLSPIPSNHPRHRPVLSRFQLQAEQARQRFLVFVRQAWHEPQTPFVTAIHFEAMCDHLKALTQGRSKNLITSARVCVLLTALALSLGGAGDAPLDRATLRGVKAVNVVIDPVGPEIQKEEVTIDLLRMRLEERLREAGIPIDTTSTAFVALRLRSVRAARGPVAIAVTISLYQPVTMVRDSNVKTAAATWETDTVVLADTKQVYRACMDSADELAGRFVTAYRSVNEPAANK